MQPPKQDIVGVQHEVVLGNAQPMSVEFHRLLEYPAVRVGLSDDVLISDDGYG